LLSQIQGLENRNNELEDIVLAMQKEINDLKSELEEMSKVTDNHSVVYRRNGTILGTEVVRHGSYATGVNPGGGGDFMGWYLNGERVNLSNLPITENTVLDAFMSESKRVSEQTRVFTSHKYSNMRVDFEDKSSAAAYGLLVVEDKNGDIRPIMNPLDSTTTLFDEGTREFFDGANKKLGIYLDSRLDRRYLKTGSVGVKGISLDREIFLINIRESVGSTKTKAIYAFREELKKNIFERVNPANWGKKFYAYFDMNNNQIQEELWVHPETASWWRIGLTFSTGWLLLPSLLSNGWTVPVAQILEQTTLRDLYEELQYATVHPWQGLECLETGRLVVTEDGKAIRVNPRTNQLTENMGWSIFNSVTGLPVVFHNADIITTDKRQQRIENRVIGGVSSAVLVEVVTVWSLLEGGVEFWIDTISTDL
jgi:hypothetical protein